MNAEVFVDTNVLLYTRQMGCRIVYSEDLNAGQDYDGVRVVNPFRSASAVTPPP